MEASWKSLGGISEAFGSILGGLGGVLEGMLSRDKSKKAQDANTLEKQRKLTLFGLPRGRLGGVLDALGGVLEASGRRLGRFWRRSWASWRRLGPSWRRLGGALGGLGGVLETSWAVLEASWRLFEGVLEVMLSKN